MIWFYSTNYFSPCYTKYSYTENVFSPKHHHWYMSAQTTTDIIIWVSQISIWHIGMIFLQIAAHVWVEGKPH